MGGGTLIEPEFTKGQMALIEKKIFESLPCSTNKVCKEVTEVKSDLKATKRITVWGNISIIVTVIVFIFTLVMVNSNLQARLDKMDYVMGIK